MRSGYGHTKTWGRKKRSKFRGARLNRRVTRTHFSGGKNENGIRRRGATRGLHKHHPFCPREIPGPRGPDGTLVLRGGRLFDGTGAPVREAPVVIERNKIAKIF